ncbi:MAG TPA: nuclear transport factor 2 family protein [Chryseosolibacter sp.]
MHPNEDIIHQFYKAFQAKDFKTMQNLYRDDAGFSDPVFQNLNAKEVRAMWEMLVSGATDLKIEHSDVFADERSGRCMWQAWYTFTATGRRVHNVIYATFAFRDGKILSHYDKFDFWRWSKMALGTPGLLMGWTPLIRNKVRKTARARLAKFIGNR